MSLFLRVAVLVASSASPQRLAAQRDGALASSGNYIVGHDGFHAQPASC
jgi:hypothetical protein